MIPSAWDLGPALSNDAGQHVATKFLLPLRPSLEMQGMKLSSHVEQLNALPKPGAAEPRLKVGHAGPRCKNLHPG